MVRFTEEDLIGKLHFLWSGRWRGSFPPSSNYLDEKNCLVRKKHNQKSTLTENLTFLVLLQVVQVRWTPQWAIEILTISFMLLLLLVIQPFSISRDQNGNAATVLFYAIPAIATFIKYIKIQGQNFHLIM